MKHVFPGSLVGRAVLVLVAGLTLSHAATMALYAVDRQQERLSTCEALLGERVAVLARVFEVSPPTVRPAMAEAMTRQALAVHWVSPDAVASTPMAPARLPPPEKDSARMILAALEHDRPNAVYQLGPPQPAPEKMPGWGVLGALRRSLLDPPTERSLSVAMQLKDGSRLDIDLSVPPPFSLWSADFVRSVGLMAVAVVLFAYGASRWIMAPLATFTRAAAKLGQNVKAPPLAVDGLAEVRGAAETFNAMQQSIRRVLDDRTQMMAAIAHDLRTPITRMRLRTEMLPAGAVNKRMLRDLAEMDAMVTACLQFVRQDATEEKSEPIDLAALLETICDEASEAAEDASFVWSGSTPYACQPLAMKRAFANLVGNAVKYGHRAAVSVDCTAHGITVFVDDEGPGIPPEEMEAVFAPFHRIETSRNRTTGGIGLGLSVARGIIRAHGGDIGLVNRDGGGLRVIVTLPKSLQGLAA